MGVDEGLAIRSAELVDQSSGLLDVKISKVMADSTAFLACSPGPHFLRFGSYEGGKGRSLRYWRFQSCKHAERCYPSRGSVNPGFNLFSTPAKIKQGGLIQNAKPT